MMRNTVSLNSDTDFPKGNLGEKEKEMKYPNLGVELMYYYKTYEYINTSNEVISSQWKTIYHFSLTLCGLSGSVISVIEGVKVSGIQVRHMQGPGWQPLIADLI